ncbi:hypothetical protein HY636_00590 [Candidatus Woesearchaeota archaeon]|nr:hypothetical protein [Candidatus Woesearchaeota archaeon]
MGSSFYEAIEEDRRLSARPKGSQHGSSPYLGAPQPNASGPQVVVSPSPVLQSASPHQPASSPQQSPAYSSTSSSSVLQPASPRQIVSSQQQSPSYSPVSHTLTGLLTAPNINVPSTPITDSALRRYYSYLEQAVDNGVEDIFHHRFIEEVYTLAGISKKDFEKAERKISKLEEMITNYENVNQNINLAGVYATLTPIAASALGNALGYLFLGFTANSVSMNIGFTSLITLIASPLPFFIGSYLYKLACNRKAINGRRNLNAVEQQYADRLQIRQQIEHEYLSGDVRTVIGRVGEINYAKIMKNVL